MTFLLPNGELEYKNLILGYSYRWEGPMLILKEFFIASPSDLQELCLNGIILSRNTIKWNLSTLDLL